MNIFNNLSIDGQYLENIKKELEYSFRKDHDLLYEVLNNKILCLQNEISKLNSKIDKIENKSNFSENNNIYKEIRNNMNNLHERVTKQVIETKYSDYHIF